MAKVILAGGPSFALFNPSLHVSLGLLYLGAALRQAGHDVKIHATGTKRFHHPVAGDLSLQFETLHLPGDEGQTLFTFTAEPGSASANALAFLASWAASPSETITAAQPSVPDTRAPSGPHIPGKTEPTHD